MSFFTQQKSFYALNVQSQDLFNTQEVQNPTQFGSHFFGTQKDGSLCQSQQNDDDWESQIPSIFTDARSERPLNHSSNPFSQSQIDFERKVEAELTFIDQNSQFLFSDEENEEVEPEKSISEFFSSPNASGSVRNINRTPAERTFPDSPNKSFSQASGEAQSLSTGAQKNIFEESSQSQQRRPQSSNHFLSANASLRYQTPVSSRQNQSFKSSVQPRPQFQDTQDNVFNTQDDVFKTQSDLYKSSNSTFRTPLCREVRSPTLDPTSLQASPFQTATTSQKSFKTSQYEASASQHQASKSQNQALSFRSQKQLSQQQLSQASSISEPIDVDFDPVNSVPSSISKLHKKLKESYSDAVFTRVVASQLCSDAFPIDAYSNLKLNLLLSLVSINDYSVPLQVAVIGQETSHANIIMSAIGKYADRFVSSSIANFEGSTVTRDGAIEAGPLLMAQNGVLYIGDWSRLQPNAVMKVLRVIETGRVAMEKVQQSVPLECAIWTYWSSTNKIKKDTSTVNQFISVFGIPTMIDDAPNDNDIIDHILSSECKTEDTFNIDDDDMLRYLNYAAKQRVTMETEAEEMLEDYFSAVRVVKPDALAPKAFEVLKQMAESHAKLSLRNQVIPVDALAAINICEKYVRCLFAKDAYSSPPEPQITNIDDIDSYHVQLFKWSETFTVNILHK